MPWLSNWFYKVTHGNIDIDELKQKIKSGTATPEDLQAYIVDLDERIQTMVKELKTLYKKFNITFTGFKSMDLACEYLRISIKDGSESAYNNLIKLESMVTSEQQRHLSLIKMAITRDGKRVIELINQNPEYKKTFDSIFGMRDASGKIKEDGLYQKLWSEIHKLAEYLLIQKTKIYH